MARLSKSVAGKSLLREEDDGEAKLSGKSLLREESGRSEIVRVALARGRRWRSSIVGESPRGLLTAGATGGLEISDEKGNIEVGRSCARKTDEALVEIGYEHTVK